MATLNLWKNFEKRKNSTKQPPSTSGSYDTLSVALKEGTSLEQPVFIIKSNDFSYNYAQFNSTYYYVDDIVSEKNQLLELHCSRDLLATYKDKIKAASAHVLYYTHNNTEIADKRLSTKTTQTTDSASGSFDYFGVGLTNVLSLVGKDEVASFKLNLSEIRSIVSQSFFDTLENEISQVPAIDNSSEANAISDAGRFVVDLLKTAAISATYVGKVAECIRNCYILPMDPAAWGGTLHDVYIGKCQALSGPNTPIQGYVLSSSERVLHDSATVNIPWQASDWRRNAPYHEIYLYIPCIGLTTISPSDVIGAVTLHVELELDKLSGDVIVNVGTTDKVLAQYTTNVAVNYPIGSANVDPARALTNIGSAISALSGGDPINSAINASLGLANAINPMPMSIGSNGGGAFLGLVGYQGKKIYCFTIFHDTTVTPSSVSAIAGTPYNGVMSLGSVPTDGYVQTSGASVEVGAFGNDKDIINSYLNGGIYIE